MKQLVSRGESRINSTKQAQIRSGLISMRVAICFFLTAVAWQASAGDGLILTNFTTPTNLAIRIATAGSIIATNWRASSQGEPGLGFSISGDKVEPLVRALSNARAYTDSTVAALVEYELRFYRGTNQLDTVRFSGRMFVNQHDRKQFFEETGLLEKVSDSLENMQQAAEQNKYGDEWFAATNKAEAKQWLKESAHSVLNGNKEKVVHFVEAFYTAGAAKVFVGGIHPEGEAQSATADSLIVVLPKDPAAREKVFLIAKRAFNEWWNYLGWDTDVGQKYLFYSFKNGPRHP